MTKAMDQRRTRGRPQRSASQRAEMRDQIERAASKLFQTDGYSAVSMRRIAKEVGCSPMAIYAYFDNKIDVLRSLWAQVFADLFDHVSNEVAAATSFDAKLSALSIGYVQYWIDNPERYRMVFMAEGVSQSDVTVFVDDPSVAAHFAQFFDLVSEVLDQSVSTPSVKQNTDFLVATLHGVAHAHITMSGYGWTDPELLVQMAVGSLK